MSVKKYLMELMQGNKNICWLFSNTVKQNPYNDRKLPSRDSFIHGGKSLATENWPLPFFCYSRPWLFYNAAPGVGVVIWRIACSQGAIQVDMRDIRD